MKLKLCLMLCALCAPERPVAAGGPGDSATAGDAYLLRYKFAPGETARWQVEHRAIIRTTVGGTSQTAETLSTSIKVWQVSRVDAAGQATFVHSVESVDMRQKLTGRQEVRYNSLTDSEPPPGFEDVAKAVGVALAEITLDAQGNLVRREQLHGDSAPSLGPLTIPLPAEAVPVGHPWFLPNEVSVSLKSGQVKRIKTRQRFTLEEVADGVATVRVETQVLTPVNNPEIEVQLIQGKSNGTIHFDIEAGRVIDQQTDVDERVHGFQGEASSLHCVTRFTEKLLPAQATTARQAPPAPRKSDQTR